MAAAPIAAAVALLPGTAQAWPDRAVDYVIPFGDGGESTIAANIQKPIFKRLTGRDLAIHNKPGGGGAVVWSQLNKMRGDGSTIVGINLPHIVIQPTLGAGYRTKDITVVNIFHYTPHALVVSDDSPYDTLEDFLEDARERPGELLISGSGKGSANHLAQSQFDKLAKIDTRYRAYKGTAASMAALLAGRVDAAWAYSTVAPKYKGDVRLLAVATEMRQSIVPDTPTLRELGFEMIGGAYRGIAVPRSTPEPLRQRVSDIFMRINGDQENIDRKSAVGFVPVSIPYKDARTFIQERRVEYLELARRAGLTP